MCCDKRYIYATDLVAKSSLTDFAPTIDITALASGDFIHSTAIQIPCAVSETGGHGEVYGIHVAEVATGTVEKIDLRFWIFNGLPAATITANAARAWANADAKLLAGYIDIVTADYTDTGATSAMVFKDLRNGTGLGGTVVSLNTLTTTAYVVIEARAGVTFDNASAIQFKLLLKRS